jgi:hypothetical protein
MRPEGFFDDPEKHLEAPDEGERRRQHRLAVDLYGALCATDGCIDPPNQEPSLDNCEQPYREGAVPEFSPPQFKTPKPDLPPASRDALHAALRVGVDDVEGAAELLASSMKAPELMYRLLEREDEERRERALALLEVGEPSAALRYAKCCRQSAQLGCPSEFGAGGCGYEENYTPITCDHLLCETCADRRKGHAVEKYQPAAQSWESPTLITLTTENVDDPVRGVEEIKSAFGRLRRRTIPAAGETCRDGSVRRWAWTDNGEPAKLWQAKLLEGGRDDLARRIKRKYVKEGKQIPWDALVSGGFYGVDVRQKGPEEFNVHLHVLADAAYIPQTALSAVWEDVSGASVVDVRRIYDRGTESLEEAVMETVGYATKAPEFEEVEMAARFAKAMKGKRLVQPFGSLHGSTPRVGNNLLCGRCERSPRWWNYLGVVDGRRETMGSVHDGESTGNDPPDTGN